MKPLFCASGIICFLVTLLACTEKPYKDDPVFSVTGARTRIVWVQDQAAGSPDTYCRSSGLQIMGYDSHDGRGERAILQKTGNFFRPLLTADGNRVVYTDRARLMVCVVNFDGSGYREVVRGIAGDTGYDGKSGTEWIYVGEIPDEDEKGERIDRYPGKVFRRVMRFPLDGPGEGELVWDHTRTTIDNFQVSRDGTRAVAGFPWPYSGLATLPNQSWQKLRDGCWQSLSPDDSYVCWTFDGPHKGIFMHDTVNARSWKVNFHEAPGIGIHPVYHPRWSNHPRFMVMTGPYKAGGKNNPVLNGGEAVEIYLGRFNDDYTDIERWVRVSRNDRGDFYPDAWVEGAEDCRSLEERVRRETERLKKTSTAQAGEMSPYRKRFKRWPGDPAGLIYVWENNLEGNQIETGGKLVRSCRGTLQGKARFGRFYDLDLYGGSFRPEGIDDVLRDACRKRHELSLEAVLTPVVINKKRPAQIIAFSPPGGKDSSGEPSFILEQIKDRLIFCLRTEGGDDHGGITLCRLSAKKAQHVIISYASGDLRCYLDGEKVFESGGVVGGFGDWQPSRLIFGSDWEGLYDWAGKLEGVALYSRRIAEPEAVEKYRLYAEKLGDRRPIPRHSVRAKLLEMTPVPSVASIEPYLRGLVVFRYEVVNVLSGEMDTREILVAHWGIMDRKILPDIAAKEAGQIYELHLENFEDHPQLGSELRLNAIENIFLPMYYEVGKIAGRAQSKKPISRDRAEE